MYCCFLTRVFLAALLCLVVVSCYKRQARVVGKSSSSLLCMNVASSSSAHLLKRVGDMAVDKVSVALQGKGSDLVVKMGYSVGLGCESWRANGFRGGIENWGGGAPYVDWVSKSYLESEDASSSSLFSQIKVFVFMSDQCRIPDFQLRLSASSSNKSRVPLASVGSFDDINYPPPLYHLQLDYTPRVDLISSVPPLLSSLEYYDKYFLGVDDALWSALANSGEGIKRQIPTISGILIWLFLNHIV